MQKIIIKYPRRRLVKLGTTSLAVVIPIDFVREHQIQHDDIVEIFDDGELERGLKLIFKTSGGRK